MVRCLVLLAADTGGVGFCGKAQRRVLLQGLVTRARANTVDDHKLSWCHDGPEAANVCDAIRQLKPSVYLDIASMVRQPAFSDVKHVVPLHFTCLSDACLGPGLRSLGFLKCINCRLVLPQGDALPLSREACCLLADNSERPMLFALSQPGAQW
jgi:hypothetical protein